MLGELYIVGLEHPRFIHLHTYLYEEEKFKVGQIVSTTLRNRHGTFTNLPKRFREDDFENVRSTNFKDLPSRFSCLFLSDDLENTRYWANKICSRTGNCQCVEVELLTGRYVYLDEQIYNIEHFSKADIIKEAYSYWSGEEVIDDPIIVILFEGEFRVCSEIEL